MITYYKQQTLQGGSVTGFRNEDSEPWIMYDTPPHSAVLKFKVGFGHYPLPEWKRRDINMMEQVERAVYASLKVEGFSHQDFDLLNTFQKTQVNKMARAAIAAMREPTQEMQAMGWAYHSEIGRMELPAAYTRMIDAALSEASDTPVNTSLEK